MIGSYLKRLEAEISETLRQSIDKDSVSLYASQNYNTVEVGVASLNIDFNYIASEIAQDVLSVVETAYDDGWNDGFQDGWDEGYDEAKRELENQKEGSDSGWEIMASRDTNSHRCEHQICSNEQDRGENDYLYCLWDWGRQEIGGVSIELMLGEEHKWKL